MIEFFEVRPETELNQGQIDRYTEVKTMAVGYFEAQIVRPYDDRGMTFDKASLYAVTDADEADTLLAAVQDAIPDVEFVVEPKQHATATKFNPLLVG